MYVFRYFKNKRKNELKLNKNDIIKAINSLLKEETYENTF